MSTENLHEDYLRLSLTPFRFKIFQALSLLMSRNECNLPKSEDRMTFPHKREKEREEESHRADLSVEIISISPLPSHFIRVSYSSLVQ